MGRTKKLPKQDQRKQEPIPGVDVCVDCGRPISEEDRYQRWGYCRLCDTSNQNLPTWEELENVAG